MVQSQVLSIKLWMWILLLLAVVYGTHAVLKHGEQVQRVRDAFNVQSTSQQSRICRNGNPGAEFYSPDLDTWMYLCYYGNGEFDVWILSDMLQRNAKEITAIPKEHMRNALQYLRNVIAKRNYLLRRIDPQFPVHLFEETLR